MSKDLEVKLQKYTMLPLQIRSQHHYAALVQKLQDAKEYRAEVDATFNPILKAQNEVLRVTREQKKKFTDKLDAFESAARRALSAWSEEQKRLEESLEVSIEDCMAVVPEYREPVRPVAGVSEREVYSWEVVDEAAIPREFLEPNSARITEHVRKLKDYANIPGIRVIKKIAHTIRRKKF